jgi:hypothetical protein
MMDKSAGAGGCVSHIASGQWFLPSAMGAVDVLAALSHWYAPLSGMSGRTPVPLNRRWR